MTPTLEELDHRIVALTAAVDQLEARSTENENQLGQAQTLTLDLAASIVTLADLAGEALVAMESPEVSVADLMRPVLVGLVAVGDLAMQTAVAVQAAQLP